VLIWCRIDPQVVALSSLMLRAVAGAMALGAFVIPTLYAACVFKVLDINDRRTLCCRSQNEMLWLLER
jgi:hypothetical protein